MKEIKASQLFSYLNDLFPQKESEEWDRVGFQISEIFSLPSQDRIKNIITCLDVTTDVVKFAIKKNSNLIICHHPFVFKEWELEQENEAKKILMDLLIEKEIQVYSIHTNYDLSSHQAIYSLLESKFNVKEFKKSDEGLINVKLFDEISLEILMENVKFIFGSKIARASRNFENGQLTDCFYICPGAGASYMIESKLKNCIFITGEAKWSEYLYAIENNIILISIGHYMENYFIEDIQTKIMKTFFDEVDCYTFDIKNMWVEK